MFTMAQSDFIKATPVVTGRHSMPRARRRLFRGVWLGLCLLYAVALPGQESELVVRIPRPESSLDTRNGYFIELLESALEKTRATDGPFRIEFSRLDMLVQGRAMELLKRGDRIDVVHTMTSIDRERELLPIRIPLLKGLLGCRVFLIRRADEARFAAVRTLDDLRTFTAGQGLRWPDVAILRANDIPVMEGRNYEGLFEMLRRERFDYFPRGVTEAWEEGQLHAQQDLIVEKTLMLVYPTAIYYFVNRENTLLADRIERGLRRALADGTLDRLFDRYYGRMLEQTAMERRRILRLENPLLPPETPTNEPELWYRIPD